MQALEHIDDPRQPSNGTLHDFREILVIAICAVLCDNDTFEEMVAWARYKQDWLRRFLSLKNGIPSEDTFLRIFRLMDPKQFESAFRTWAGGILPALDNEQLAIDGKTVRGSSRGGRQAVHMVSAFATQAGLVLGQEKVHEKSNEITAIPALLESLKLKGLLVSFDAMGCQRDIARQIHQQGGDYLLAVKGNQPALLSAVEAAFIDAGDAPNAHGTAERSHGREVVQLARVLPVAERVDAEAWPGCQTLGVIDSLRQIGDQQGQWERRYYISSRLLSAEELAQAARAHWGIENRLHWMLDVNFAEDASSVCKDYAPENLSLLKKIVLNLVRPVPMGKNGKMSMRIKRKAAAWDDDVRAQFLGLAPL